MVPDTPSHGSDHLCLIWKESIHNCRWYRADTACGTDGRTDGRTDRRTDGRTEWNQYTPPTTSLCGGYNYACWYLGTPYISASWHGMLSALVALCVGNPPNTDGFPSQMENFGVFLVASLNKLLNKQSVCRWFEKLWRSCETRNL